MPFPRLSDGGQEKRQEIPISRKQKVISRTPQPRDRVERAPNKLLASVTDRGKEYPFNQDDVRVRTTAVDAVRVTVMVLCDGVSGGQHADLASAAGAAAATDFLLTHLSLGGDTRKGMRQALFEADSAIREIPYDQKRRNNNPPGSTIVAAVAIRKRLTVGWIGDSRCYLVDKIGAKLLTHDHSWVNAVVDGGVMPRERALRSPEAHQITQCLGQLHGNGATDIAEPSVAGFDLPDSGIVVLCSDGLWNYIASPEHLASLVKFGTNAPDALTQARSLVDFALSEGGKDNISVAVLLK
jgi:serine/threonine protein phosphatase PrpC